MERILGWWIGLTVIAVIWREPIAKSLSKLTPRFFAESWRLAYRLLWAFPVWLMLIIFSSAVLHSMFPDEPVYLLSGSWIILAPAFFWGAAILWVALAGIGAAKDSSGVQTMNDRADALMEGIWTWLARALKYGAWLVGAAVAALALYIFGSWANERIEAMPTSEAVIVGAFIIAIAVSGARRA